MIARLAKTSPLAFITRLTAVVLAIILTAVCLTLCAGCSNGTQQVAMTPASSQATSSSAEQANQASKAMVLVAAKSKTTDSTSNGAIDINSQPLLVDMTTGAIFYPMISEGELFNEQGQPIEITALQPGNVVEVSGDGIMLESYPGQYPGIHRVRVISQGSPDDIKPYEAEIAEIGLLGESSTDAAPHATLAYKSSNAQVSVMLDAVAYDWTNEGGSKAINELNIIDESKLLVSDLPDARVDEDVDAAIEFAVGEQPQSAIVASYPIEKTANGFLTNATNESISSIAPSANSLSNGKVAFAMVPNNLYVINCQFDQGTATYAFVAIA